MEARDTGPERKAGDPSPQEKRSPREKPGSVCLEKEKRAVRVIRKCDMATLFGPLSEPRTRRRRLRTAYQV